MDLYSIITPINELTQDIIDKANVYRSDPHTAHIKPEYLKIEKSVEICNDLKHKLENDNETTDSKKVKLEKESHNNQRKSTKKHERITLSKRNTFKICPYVARCNECIFGDKCKYSHDIAGWLTSDSKPENISDECYFFNTHGYCQFGLSCRFNSKHIEFKDNKYVNINKNESNDATVHVYNVLNNDLKQKLWKKNYDFECSKQINDTVHRYVASKVNYKYNPNKGIVQKQSNNMDSDDNSNKNDENNEIQEAKKSKYGSVTDEDLIRLRKCEKKMIDWKNKLYLAPLTTVGNLPFRRICKEFGADITCCEMAMSTNLLTGQASEWALLKRHESEDIFGVQLAGAYQDSLTKACQIIHENKFNVDFVDINCGCPIDLVFNKGAGCALMTRLEHFEKIIRSLDILLPMPVTCKMRTGIKEDLWFTHDLIPKLKTWGVSMITLHGRTKNQRYSKLADWEYVDKCAMLSDPVPLFGCGDILSHQDYDSHMSNTKIAGCMIARGALYKPWLFTEIKEQRDWDISAAERFEILKKFANYGLEHWGSDTQGVETTRKFLLEWLSFLYRYIPVGLLEELPQRINSRPPAFFGRNELETLLSSPNCSDWIRISEMLLGPVPDGFQFIPKHKANAY